MIRRLGTTENNIQSQQYDVDGSRYVVYGWYELVFRDSWEGWLSFFTIIMYHRSSARVYHFESLTFSILNLSRSP